MSGAQNRIVSVNDDRDRVAKHLWQGSLPWEGLDPKRFQVLVLCAKEYQPRGQFPGLRVVHVPLDDSGVPMLPEEIRGAITAAREVLAQLKAGKRVLVTCAAGLNRSGLVCALALKGLGATADQAIAMVRRARGPRALSNPYFESLIRTDGVFA